GDNHFLGPLGGDGVFLGPADNGDISVSGNRFNEVAGDAITLQDVQGSNSIKDNEITPPVAGGGGSGIVLLDAPSGSIEVTNNQIIGATSMAVIIERIGAEVLFDGNLIEGTVPPINTGGDHLQAAYAVASINSKNIRVTDNIIRKNASAGMVHDMGGWGSFLRRPELSGDASAFVQGNSFSDNNDNNFVVQNGVSQTEFTGQERDGPGSPHDQAALPMGERHGHTRCGDGRTNGIEVCDSSDPLSRSVCQPGTCELRDEQRSSSGQGFSCFVASDHTLHCVGQNIRSIFVPGEGDNGDNPDPRDLTSIVLDNRAIVSVAAGRRHVCVLTLNGQVGCWGAGEKGQLGNGRETRFSGFAPVTDGADQILSNISGIAAHKDTSCAWSHAGAVYCWGANSTGQAGADPAQQTLLHANLIAEPANTRGFKVKGAARGDGFTCLLTEQGKVRCFGANNSLQLGITNGNLNNACRQAGVDQICHYDPQAEIKIGTRSDPQPLIANSLSAGRGACAITTNNQVYCWGVNTQGAIPRTEPAALLGVGGQGPGQVELGGSQRISMGKFHGCIQATNQDLKCWGNEGILWSGSNGNSATVSLATVGIGDENLGGSAEFSAGANHTCAMREDRQIYCWGYWNAAPARDPRPVETAHFGTLP
ncbi:MAG: right-handed parallel beta-helix repeat-containing protein, partial [Myxococcota bacterium]|nr:right-handed parallel beta-helix repeat-containing protein [Myxococcota bacterium]